MKLTEDECRAILVLKNQPEFERLLAAMGRFAEEANQRLVMGKFESGQLHVQQGRTQALVQLMESLASASELLNQYNAKPTR